MGLTWLWSVALVCLALSTSPTWCRVLDGSELGIVVKREVNGDEAEAAEPEVSTVRAATEGSLLDIFSTSSKEKKVPRAIMKSLHATSNITFRYAKTRIESKILNPADVAQEIFFDVIIPEQAFISGFSMEIDGQVYNAYVKEKQEAQKVYDAAVKQGVTAGQVKQSARDSDRFSVSVNVEPQKKVKFNLTYEELLERKYGSYRHTININPGQIVEDLAIDITVHENREITEFRVPEFQSGNEVYPVSDIKDFDLAVTERLSPTDVKVSLRPSIEDQRKLQKKPTDSASVSDGQTVEGMSGQFTIEYKVADESDGGEILVNDGYFVHFFAPQNLPPLKKHVVFVLDVSGSMVGRKIEQVKQAMDSILSELGPQDFFNIVEFAYSVHVPDLDEESPGNSLVRVLSYDAREMDGVKNDTKKVKPFPATPEYIQKGKEVVKKMKADGGTNIYDALNVAIELAKTGIKKDTVKRSVSEEDTKFVQPQPMIIFLTDGEATTGETSSSKILKNVDEKNNDPRIPIFSLAFGADADFTLLKRVALLSNAFARQIYEAADTSLQLTNFYKQISSPTLSNVKFVYPPEEVQNETITKVHFDHFFGGSELVVSGKLKEESIAKSEAPVVEVQSENGVHNFSVNHISQSPSFLKMEPNYKPLERLWVYLTIKQLLREAELMKARSYLINYNEETKPLQLAPEEKALRLALETVKKGVYSLFRLIIDCLNAKLKMIQSIFDSLSNDFVYVDTVKPKALPRKNTTETIVELAVKYSFVCPLTSLVVVKPGALSDAKIEPASNHPTYLSHSNFGLVAAALPLQYGPSGFHKRLGTFQVSGQGIHGFAAAAPQPLRTFDVQEAGGSFATAPQPTSTTSAPLDSPGTSESTLSANLTLDSIPWLSQILTGDNVVRFPEDSNSTDYILGRNQVNDQYGQCTNPSGAAGVCRHLEHCVLSDILGDVDTYYKDFFCVIPGNYAGICCPEPIPATAESSNPP